MLNVTLNTVYYTLSKYSLVYTILFCDKTIDGKKKNFFKLKKLGK